MQRIKIPFGGLNATPARNAGRPLRGILRRHRPRHHAPGCPASLRPHRRHARRSCAGWPRSESPPAKPAATRSQRHGAAPSPASAATQTFDVTPYAKAPAYFMLGHPDAQDVRPQVQDRVLRLRATNACALVRLHDIGAIAATREVDGKTARLRVLCRRRPRPGAAAGQAVRRFRARGRDCFPLAQAIGARLRAARRKEEPQHGAHEVPGQQARHRGIQAAGDGRARDPAARSALDGLPQGRRRLCRRSRSSRRRCCRSARRRPEGFDAVARHQRLPAAAGRLCDRHRRAAAGRYHGDSAAHSWPTSRAST